MNGEVHLWLPGMPAHGYGNSSSLTSPAGFDGFPASVSLMHTRVLAGLLALPGHRHLELPKRP